jgi:hypothetical protein
MPWLKSVQIIKLIYSVALVYFDLVTGTRNDVFSQNRCANC